MPRHWYSIIIIILTAGMFNIYVASSDGSVVSAEKRTEVVEKVTGFIVNNFSESESENENEWNEPETDFVEWEASGTMDSSADEITGYLNEVSGNNLEQLLQLRGAHHADVLAVYGEPIEMYEEIPETSFAGEIHYNFFNFFSSEEYVYEFVLTDISSDLNEEEVINMFGNPEFSGVDDMDGVVYLGYGTPDYEAVFYYDLKGGKKEITHISIN